MKPSARRKLRRVEFYLLLLLAFGAFASQFAAFMQSREALRESRRANHRLCQGLDYVFYLDRQTIASSPQDTANFLRLMGLPKPQVDALKAAAQKQVDREIARRPKLDCVHVVIPVPPVPPVHRR